MSESKHTPGPWQVGTAKGHNASIVHDDKDIGIAAVYGIPLHTTLAVVQQDGRWAECLGNARLIAAAPDMLEALKQAMETLKAFDPGDPTTETGWKHDELCNAWAFCQVAISKATGEPVEMREAS